MDNRKEWYNILQPDGTWLGYGYCPETGLYHWDKNANYAGYTAEELVAKGAE